MAFTPKDWKDDPDHTTPITAAALEDLETRLSAYTDSVGGTLQPLDSDLTALAALSTTPFGRALLELANAGAGRTALGLGTAATAATGDFDAAGAAAAAQAASQPVDSDLTAIAALATTPFGRGLLTSADAAALRSSAGLGTSATLNVPASGDAAAGEVVKGSDSRLPSTGQKNALAGLHGTPGTGNEYATKQSIGAAGTAGKALAADDATTTDSRAPSGSASGDLSGSFPGPTVAKVQGKTLPSAPGAGQDGKSWKWDNGSGAWVFTSASVDAHGVRHADGGADEITTALDPRAYPTGYGTLAARPAAGVQGRRYYAYDDNGGTEYLDSGSAWIALDLAGREVANGYAQITSNFTYSTDNNFTDVTGLTITITPLQAAVLLVLMGGNIQSDTTASTPQVIITDSANTQVAPTVSETVITGALIASPVYTEAHLSLTPGASVTYKVRIKRGSVGASTVTLGATSPGPTRLRAVYL